MAGTVHVPLHQLPAAMQMSSAEWESSFEMPRPRFDDWIIMLSRASKRATWAAHLAADAGFKHCLVYDQVSYALHHFLMLSDPWHVCSCLVVK